MRMPDPTLVAATRTEWEREVVVWEEMVREAREEGLTLFETESGWAIVIRVRDEE
jgi:hypothetical protein